MSKNITIISTKTWEENTLFDKSDIVQNENLKPVLNEFFGVINWADILSDDALNTLCKDKIEPSHPNINIKRLKYEESARNTIWQIVKDDVEKKEEYKAAVQKREVHKVKGTDVYGIRALNNSRDANDWIPTLLKIAQILGNNDGEINVNLFLHDKDITDDKYHQTVIEVSDVKTILPKGEDISNYGITKCTLIFYKHTTNPIIKLIEHFPDENLQSNIENAINAVRRLSSMIKDCSEEMNNSQQ